MTWRNHSTHQEETKAVKAALAEAGIKAKVGHGSGTAWAWLEINLGSGNWGLHDRAVQIAQSVTGRHGDYNGQISIMAQ